jgi:hypothetical protein
MSKRKTFNVKAIVERANYQLSHSVLGPDFRYGVRSMVEEILFSTSNYKGYRHLTKDEVPQGHVPGIYMDVDGKMLPDTERFEGTDRTRVEYAVPQ